MEMAWWINDDPRTPGHIAIVEVEVLARKEDRIEVSHLGMTMLVPTDRLLFAERLRIVPLNNVVTYWDHE